MAMFIKFIMKMEEIMMPIRLELRTRTDSSWGSDKGQFYFLYEAKISDDQSKLRNYLTFNFTNILFRSTTYRRELQKFLKDEKRELKL